MRSRITLLFAVLATGAAFGGSLVTGQSAPTATGPAVTAVTGIAYVRGGEVRLIQPDGTGDRLLWQSPSKAPRSPFVHPVRDLAWRPDGGELAFASDHEQAYSWFQDDIYAVRADGTGLRRLTNPPAKADLGRLPAGTVKLTLSNRRLEAGPYIVYAMGASRPESVTVPPGSAEIVTFTAVARVEQRVGPPPGPAGRSLHHQSKRLQPAPPPEGRDIPRVEPGVVLNFVTANGVGSSV